MFEVNGIANAITRLRVAKELGEKPDTVALLAELEQFLGYLNACHAHKPIEAPYSWHEFKQISGAEAELIHDHGNNGENEATCGYCNGDYATDDRDETPEGFPVLRPITTKLPTVEDWQKLILEFAELAKP